MLFFVGPAFDYKLRGVLACGLFCVSVFGKPTVQPVEKQILVEGQGKVEPSPDLIFRPETDERLIAAEKAIGDGRAKSARKTQTTFDLDDFYNPKSWESMLEDSDYRDLAANTRRLKQNKFDAKYKQQKAELDVDAEGADEEEDDFEYEPADVPAVDVQLDRSPSATEDYDRTNQRRDDEDMGGASKVADDAASWMDVFGADPEFAREAEEEKRSAQMNALLPENDYVDEEKDVEDPENTELVSEEEVEKSDVDPVYYSETLKRKKRDYVAYDDDYSSAYLDNRPKKRVHRTDDRREELDASDDIFKDYQNSKEQQSSDGETDEDVSNADSEDAQGSKNSGAAFTDDENMAAAEDAEEDLTIAEESTENAEDDDSKESEEVSEEKEDEDATFDDEDYENMLAESGKYDRLLEAEKNRENEEKMQSNDKNADMSQENYDKHEQNRPLDREDSAYQSQYSGYEANQEDQNVEAKDLQQQHAQRGRYETDVYPDKKLAGDSVRAEWNYRRRYRPYQQSSDEISADADVDYGQQAGSGTDKNHFPPKFSREAKRTEEDVSRAHVSTERRTGNRRKMELARQQKLAQKARASIAEFDDDYEFDSEGTIAFARQKVCQFVAQQLPTYGFTGVSKPAPVNPECDVLCERSNGKQVVMHTFHLKNWPCGDDEKDRCSNDGHCEKVSRTT